MKRWIPLFSVLLLILLFGFSLYVERLSRVEVSKKSIASFSLPVLGKPNEVITEAALKGKIQLVHFWATWCNSCKREHPFIKKLAQELHLPIIGIGYLESESALHAFLEEHGDPYSLNLVDQKRTLGFEWGISGVPETLLIDKEGNIRYRFKGNLNDSTVEKYLKPAIEALKNEI